MLAIRHLIVSTILLCNFTSNAFATDFHVDPNRGSKDGDGSFAKPWKTIEEVIDSKLIETKDWVSYPPTDSTAKKIVNQGAPIKGGDTIYLYSGYHGTLSITGGYNETDITVKAAPNQKPKLKNILLRAATHWVIEGLEVSPSFNGLTKPSAIINLETHGFRGPSSDIQVKNCDVYTVPNIDAWKAEDWVAHATHGISVSAKRTSIENNRVRNIRMGITISAERAQVRYNTVTNFSGDGLRGLGDYSVFEYNTVRRSYKVDENHDDAFQSWSIGPNGKPGTGTVKGIVLRGNSFINDRAPDEPLRGTFQGIGCFDGFFEDWIIENNLIMVDHWHGITLMGAINSRIVNNTVIDLHPDRPGPSWIRISAHKNGTEGSGNIVSNNLAQSFSLSPSVVTQDNNIKVSSVEDFFINPAQYDLRLKKSSPAIDSGTSRNTPSIDIAGTLRPLGKGFDVGAFEFREGRDLAPKGPTQLRVIVN